MNLSEIIDLLVVSVVWKSRKGDLRYAAGTQEANRTTVEAAT
jgi:hypothetical protein